MKLHLPSGLRKSLLACLASLALPTLSPTLGTATTALSGAALVSFFSFQHAVADITLENNILTSTGGTKDSPSVHTAEEDESVDGILLKDTQVEQYAINNSYTTIKINGQFTVGREGLRSEGIVGESYPDPTEKEKDRKSVYPDSVNYSSLKLEGMGTFTINGDSSNFYRGLELGDGVNLEVSENTNLTYLSIAGDSNIYIAKDKTLSFAVASARGGGVVYYGGQCDIKGDLKLYGDGTFNVRQNLFPYGTDIADGEDLVDLYLNDNVTILFSQYSYGAADEFGPEYCTTRGSTFKALHLGEDAEVVTIAFLTEKSAVTFEDHFELSDSENKTLVFQSHKDDSEHSAAVYFRRGATIDTLTLKGYHLSFFTGQGDIRIKEIEDAGYLSKQVLFQNFYQAEEKIHSLYIDDEKDWEVNFGIDAGTTTEIGEPGNRRLLYSQGLIKTGDYRVTFKGTSTTDVLDIQSGQLFFTSEDSNDVVLNSNGYDDGVYDSETNTFAFTSTTTVAKGATLGLGRGVVEIGGNLNIKGDIDLSYGVRLSIGDINYEAGICKIGGLTTILYEQDDISGTGSFKRGSKYYSDFIQDIVINVVDGDAVKKAYGIAFHSNNIIKQGAGTQVLSNYDLVGALTLSGGVLELRDMRGRVVGETKGADAGATLLIHRYEKPRTKDDEGNPVDRTGNTSVTFAREIDMAASLGLDGGVDAYLGADKNIIGGLVGDSNIGGQYNSKIVNNIRLATLDNFEYEDIRNYEEVKDNEGNTYKKYDEDPWWKAPNSADLTINIKGDTTRRTHGGMLIFEDAITLVKDGTGMQEVRGILASSLLVKEGRFRIIGRDNVEGQRGWKDYRDITNITVDGWKGLNEGGGKAYFEVSVEDANYWRAENTTMTLRNGGIFRAATKGKDTDTSAELAAVTSQFYVNKLYVDSDRTDIELPEYDETEREYKTADAFIKWNNSRDRFEGDNTDDSRAYDSHVFVFGQLSSANTQGVVDSSRDYLLVIDDMTRDDSAVQGVIFRQIKDFNGTIHSNTEQKDNTGFEDSNHFFQIGMDVADVKLTDNEEGLGLDVSLIDTVNTGAYAEAETPDGRPNVFNTTLEVGGAGVYSEVFRKRGDGKLTINGENGLTIGSDRLNTEGAIGGGLIFMNYAGDIEINSNKDGNQITVGDDVTLLYTTGENNVDRGNGLTVKGGVMTFLTVDQLSELHDRHLYIDLLHLENVEDLTITDVGISLGIQGDGTDADLERLKPKINLRGINTQKTTWELKWGTANDAEKKTVYLHVTSDKVYFLRESFIWDRAWGGVAYFAPTVSDMQEQEFFAGADKADDFTFSTGMEGGFEGNSLVLTSSQFKTASSEGTNSLDRMAIRLVGGGAEKDEKTTATVIGGKLYLENDKTDSNNTAYWEVRGNSYISLIDSTLYKNDEDFADFVGEGDPDHLHFHLLVGGSSCLPMDNESMGQTEKAKGGFKGNSHIQMKGGQVDYIVGGNHVNNSAFIFRGRSFISVLDGEVNGGIVGGSTLTKGSVNKYTQAFDGSSHIFIYTPLHNLEEGTPPIQDGTNSAGGIDGGSSETGEHFTAVVGGNAWIDLPQSVVGTDQPAAAAEEDIELRPTFRGNSNIVVNLSDITGEASFEKDIVGGNYTVYHGDGNTLLDEAGKRGTEYISNGLTSYVMVTANSKHAFIGDINGASRRASAGKGETYYTGDVQVRLRGGQYQKTVVGGLWLDESATGDHHALLIGDTEVNAGVNGAETATFWRLIGGSYSLAGGSEAREEYTGNSTVFLWGGTVTETGAITGVPEEEKNDLGKLQLRVPMIVGGNLYRNNSGSELKRTGDTSVKIYGGELAGVHVVGGDQANSSTDSSSEGETSAIIKGTSSIHVTTCDKDGVAFTDTLTNQEASTVSITGLLVGGSYMTDAGEHGSVYVESTEILLRGKKETAEVNIAYETNDLHTHHDSKIAIVGGNMLVAQKTTRGDHTLTVKDLTKIDIYDAVNISGNVVGGSYTNGTEKGINTIGELDKSDEENPKVVSKQIVKIGIHGGSIEGHVYGGHYSSNATESPDRLAIGNITITMDAASSQTGGGVVTGNIVGGGYRKTTNDQTGSSTQGAITINLAAGTLKGNVYAAGFNDGQYNEKTKDEVHTLTESTHVIVESGFTFKKGENDALLEDGDLLISGGYGRADEKVARGTIKDYAKLTFWNSNSSINEWNTGKVTLRNLNVVEVWGEDEEIAVAGDLYVLRMYNQSDIDESTLLPKNFITKNGEGSLSVNRLNIWGSGETAESASGYRGRIIVNDGYIKLTGASMSTPEAALLENEPQAEEAKPAYRQDLSGGLTVNLATAVLRHYNDKGKAYLQAHELKDAGLGELYVNTNLDPDETEPNRAKISFTFGDDASTFSTLKNDRSVVETPTLEKLYYGKYYLATGLANEITKNNKEDYFDYENALADLRSWLGTWCENNKIDNHYYVDMQIIDHSLVLRVRDKREMFGWWWGCIGDNPDAGMDHYDSERGLEIDHNTDDSFTWEDGSSINWTQHGTQYLRYDAENAKDPYTDGEHNAWNLAARGQDLHFGAFGAKRTLELKADIDYKTGKEYKPGDSQKGILAPRSIWVQDAQYIFTSPSKAALSIGTDEEANADADDLMLYLQENPNKDIQRLAAGELRVGGDYWGVDKEGNADQNNASVEAELVMQVQVLAMTDAYLSDKGALVLDHEAALVKRSEGVNGTEIHFDGGVLGYMKSGAALGDLSNQVSAESSGLIRVRVGNTAMTRFHENESMTKQDFSIKWGNLTQDKLTEGVKRALEKGFEKSGADEFVLEWASKAPTAEPGETPATEWVYDGAVDVLEGELVYHHQTLDSAHTAKLAGAVSVAEKTKLTILETGANGTLQLENALSGLGHVVVGSDAAADRTADATENPYLLTGKNDGFTGVLELQGGSAAAVADLAGMKDEGSLGGKGATLRLAGRHFFFTTADKEKKEKVVSDKVLQIVDGTVNYVGGFAADEANANISLIGKLYWTDADGKSDKAKQDGILANAWGTGEAAFHHTYDGESLVDFSGTLLAGAGATKEICAAGTEGSSASSWTLKDSNGQTKVVQAQLGGAGSFIFAYQNNIRLTGYVGTTTHANDALTSLKNDTAQKTVVTIADGETANWWSGDAVDAQTSITDVSKVRGHNIATGSISGGFVLGDADNYGTWSGTLLAGGDDEALTLVNGVLKNALSKAAGNTAALEVCTTLLDGKTTESTKVDVGGTDGKWFDSITITAGGQMLGAAGTITVDDTKVTLTLTGDNVANEPEAAGKYLIVGKTENGAKLDVTKDGAKDFKLNLANDAFKSMLAKAMDETLKGKVDTYLHIVGNGSLSIDSALYEGLLSEIQGANLKLAEMLGWALKAVDGSSGDIILTYNKPGMPDFDPPLVPGPDGKPEPPEFPMTPVKVRPREIYLVIDDHSDPWNTYTDAHVVTEYGRMSSHFKATFIDDDQTLDLTLTGTPEEQAESDPTWPFPLPGDHRTGIENDKAAGGALVNNLVGMERAHFDIHNGDATRNRVSVVFCNARYENPEDIWQAEPFYDTTSAYGLDTFYDGYLTSGEGVDLVKTGRGRLTIGSEAGTGYVQMADGALTLTMGGMTLRGDGNELAVLRFAYDSAEEADKGENRVFELQNGKTTIGEISEAGSEDAGRAGADIEMDGALLVLTGESSLADSSITAQNVKRSGLARLSEVRVAEGGSLSLSNAAKVQLSNVGLILDEGGLVDVGSNRLNDVRGLDGAGELAGDGALLHITDDLVQNHDREYVFSGTLSGGVAEGSARNTLVVDDAAKLKLRNAIGGDGWDVVNNGTLIIDVDGMPKSEDKLTHLGHLTLGSGSRTSLLVDTDKPSRTLPTVTVESITALEGASFTLETIGTGRLLTDDSSFVGPRYGVAFVRAEDQQRDALTLQEGIRNLHWGMKGAATWDKLVVDAYIEDGVLWLQMDKRNMDNPLEGVAPDKNTQAGKEHATDAMNPDKNPHYDDMVGNEGGDLAGVIDSVLGDSDKGDYDRMNNTLAGLAGATTAVYGLVMADDIHRQLRTTRNRAVTASSERCWSGVSCPALFHAYILGESSYHKMDAAAYAPGYTFSNWGGTVGLDVDFNRKVDRDVNVGLSLTAMYGDLRSNTGAERLRGDMDTQYITAYVRVDRRKWMHTLVLSAGLTDLHGVSRTVNYGEGSYTTHGSTDGYSLGGVYELGYNAFTNKAGTKCLQLVANVEARHVELNAYTETGSDAALHVGDVSQDVVTFGLGARYRSVVGYNAWNRASTFEARALAKADIGDRAGTVANSLVNGSPKREEVESAKLGTVGAEVGAGLTIPCGRCGNLFMDASLELRSGYMHADANLGYRMTF